MSEFLSYVLQNTRWPMLLIWLFLGFSIQAQTGTTRGKEFYISVLPNASIVNDNDIRIYLTSSEATAVNVSVVGTSYSEVVFMGPNASQIVSIPEEFKPEKAEVQEQVGIYVQAGADISVYVLNEANATSDATLVLPIVSLGDTYMIHTYQVPPPLTSVTPSQFVVQATEASTLVEIVFSANTRNQDNVLSFTAGTPFVFDLERGQQRFFVSTGDLSGTTVRVLSEPDEPCKRIAVFAGHATTLVGEEGLPGPDHLYNQMYPTPDWGQEYVAIPYETRFKGDPVKVLALENNTTVTIDGNASFNLNRGESTVFDIMQPTFIEGSKPISVLQLTKGRDVDIDERGDSFADPFMMTLSPSNQIIKELNFVMMTNDRIERHFVQVVTLTQDLQVSFDNTDISDLFSPVAGNPTYSHATFAVNSTLHRMSSPNGFVAHAYAFGNSESFAYALGGDLGDFEVEVYDPQLGEITGGTDTGVVCEASELTFTVFSDIPVLKETYTVFEWDFGNGEVRLGDEVQFRFEEEGTYLVTMRASKAGSKCSSLIVEKTIVVTPEGVDGIDGPSSVCPDVQDIRYFVTGNLPDYTYQWFVEGGTIDGSDSGLDVTIDWSISDPGARVRVLARSPSGCLSDTVNLPIVLNEFLQPAVPRGPNQLCSDDTENVVYSTPNATGSIYTWQVEGGAIVSGQGTNMVSVNWNGVGTHKIWYGESTMTTTSLCDGVSPELSIRVYEPLASVIEVIPVSCFGESDAGATLSVSGGLGAYSYQWSTGATTADISGQATGTYTVTITDELGCELIETVILPQPDVLSGSMEVQNAICNGDKGFAIAQVMGGTLPYTYEWSTGVIANNNRLDGLTQGAYSVRVLDANDCEINLNFSITEPAELVAEFAMTPSCPGVPDGSLTLSVAGGVAPYRFDWEIRPSETSDVLGELNDGTYSVTVTDDVGCFLELTGTVTNQNPAVRFPTAFSPNDDGMNDTFGPVFNCALDFRMVVYNRWGTAVFFSDDITIGWDGNYNGQPAPGASYTYDVTYGGVINGNDFTETVRGKFRLMR